MSAADFTSYIATQSVLIFSNASARSSAVTSPVDGMLSILTTDNVVSIYNVSAWVDVIDIDTLTVTSGNYTMSGSLTLTGGTPIVLEGATADAYETSIAVTDPTADRTITLPNATGTVVTTGNLPDITALGTLTGASPIVLEGATADGYETTIAVTDPTADRTVTLADATGTVGTPGHQTDITALGTLTGATPIVLEGATADAHETTIAVTDPTADRTITLPDRAGTVAMTTLEINAQTGTTYTFVLADAGKLVTSSNGSAQTLTVPPNSSVAYAIGSQIIVQAIGSGTATLAQGSGVTIQSKDSNKAIDGQYAGASLIKRAPDTWSLIGALA